MQGHLRREDVEGMAGLILMYVSLLWMHRIKSEARTTSILCYAVTAFEMI